MEKYKKLKKYKVKARSLNTGQVEEIIIFATDEEELKKKLKERNLFLISKKEEKVSLKIKEKDIEFLFSILADSIEAGVSLVEALESIKVKNKNLQALINSLKERLEAGASFSLALQNFKEYFPSYILALVEAGEHTGNLYETLRESVKILKEIKEKREKIIKELIPPLIKLSISLILFLVFSVLVLPKVTKIELIKENIDKIYLSLANYTTIFVPTLTIVIIVFIALILLLKKKKEELFDKIMLSLPFIKKVYLNRELFLVYFVIAKMLKNKIDLYTAINIAKDFTISTKVRKSLEKAIKYLEEGETIEKALILEESYKNIVKNATTQETIAKAFEVVSNRAFANFLESTSVIPKVVNVLFFLISFYIIFLIANLVVFPYWNMYSKLG